MIHAVTLANQHFYGRQLDQMFRMRHAFYVEGHGWSGLSSTDGRETDEFDDGEVVYLMSLDPFGDVAASVRLNPTTGPTLLKKFSDWSDEPLPEVDSVWDISRWIAAQQHRRATNTRWPSNHQRELMVGILEFCLSRGLTHLTMLAEYRLAERIATYGWPLRFLGSARAYEGGKGTAVAAEIEVGQHVLALTRAKTGVVGTMLVEIGTKEISPSGPTKAPVAAPDDLRDLASFLGVERIATLVSTLASAIAGVDDRPRAIELTAAIAHLFEAAGLPVDGERSGKWKRPGLSTGLSHKVGTTDRA